MANQEQQRSDNQEEAVEQQQQASEAEPAAAEEKAAEEGESVEALQAQVADLTEQIAAAKDQALRAQAEIQNVRRRAERDVESAHKFALEKFAKELLPVVDSLERAVETPPQEGEDTAMREGVEMTLKLFVDTLAKFNLEPIDPLGEPFDPQYHEAMSMVEQPDAEPNSVIAVMQKGYTLNGRLVRPAMVVVAKGGSAGVDTKA